LMMDQYFTSHSNGQHGAAITTARSSHILQQMLLTEGSAASDPTVLLAMTTTINAAEAAGVSSLEPSVVARIYVAAALNVQLVGGTHRMLDSLYLHQAATAVPEAKRDTLGSLAWTLTPVGRQFIRSGTWNSGSFAKLRDAATGSLLLVGTLEHLTLAYRLHLLHKAVAEFQQHADLTLVHQLLQELQQNAEESQCRQSLWWTLAVQVVVSWRRGQVLQARKFFAMLERLPRQPSDTLQTAMLAALGAHQALLDGDRPLCWERLAHASTAASLDLSDVNEQTGLPAATQTLCRFLMLRQILSTRVALYRLRVYLSQSSNASPLSPDDGNFAGMLQALQKDVDVLTHFAQHYELAEPTVLLYRAIYRSLAGGRVTPTLQLFNMATKAAYRLGLPYDEALIFLHMSVCLRTSLSPSALQRHLKSAASLFERLDASDDLAATKKMLRLTALAV